MTQVFPCHHAGAELVAGLGPRLPHHRQTLHQCVTSLLSFSGYELCVLQPIHLRIITQQGTHSPKRLPVSQVSEEDGGENINQELNLSTKVYQTPVLMSVRQKKRINFSVVLQLVVALKQLVLFRSVMPAM